MIPVAGGVVYVTIRTFPPEMRQGTTGVAAGCPVSRERSRMKRHNGLAYETVGWSPWGGAGET